MTVESLQGNRRVPVQDAFDFFHAYYFNYSTGLITVESSYSAG